MAPEVVVPKQRMRGRALALVAALLAGCAPLPEVVGLERDPGFTHEALSAASLAVFGVTVEGPEPASASASLQLGGVLAERLIRKRRDLRILTAAQVADSLGLQDYTGLVREYHEHGSLDSRGLSLLAAALGGVRYLALARLEADELMTGSSVDEYTEERDGRECEIEQTSNVTVRTLVIHFTIHDLQERRRVWKGQISDSKQRTSRDDWNSCDSLLFSALSMLLSNGNPDPPERAEVLRKVFQDFALRLPRAERRGRQHGR